MAQSCGRCGRINPDDAIYCYQDGGVLARHRPNQPLHTSLRPFPHPLPFPSGQPCLNFEQLLRCCQEDWTTAVRLLREGELERFFTTLARFDLAAAARTAAAATDPDRGLDELLARIPSRTEQRPHLRITPRTVELGTLRVGEDRRIEITLTNVGSRLVYGTVTSDAVWLTLGDPPGTAKKVFQFSREQTVPVWVRGQHLRAGRRPLEVQLSIESNAGSAVVVVKAEVPIRPFAHGVLAGADSPRQLVEKIVPAPDQAAALFDSGAVADWYRSNGWPYPVQGPSAAGLDGVRQFFKVLGLSEELEQPEPAPATAARAVVPFPEGVLAGAAGPKELIEKARAAPRDAAPLFDSGTVAAWYERNGWTYPVPGPRALGIDAVYQFLKAVEGWTPSPLAILVPADARVPDTARIRISEQSIHLRGQVGEQIRHVLSAKPKVAGSRPVRARASSDQAWLGIGATQLDDARATIMLVVPVVPDRPGETLHARVRVTVNDAHSFVVPVTLSVGQGPEAATGTPSALSS
jgi:hypothetical protein